MLSPKDAGAAGIAHRARTVATDEPRAVLGLPPDATAEAARAAYFRLSKLWHPDRLPADLAMFRDEVSTIFDHMTRAHRTLTESSARMAVARPRADAIREIEQALSKHEYEVVTEVSKELTSANADDAEAHALAAWAQASAGDAPETTLRASLLALDHAVHLDRHCAPAYFFRGMLHKRLHDNIAAFRDFARVVQLDPRHVDAQREVRVFEMRARKGSGEHALDALVMAQARKK
jgi:curved DNA-binding protein CbpA